MSEPAQFPQLSDDDLKRILIPPTAKKKPLRVVMDTDFNNEVDDYFALAWLLLQQLSPSNELNQVNLEAVYVAPFSFEARLNKLIKAYKIDDIDENDRTEQQKAFLSGYQTRIESIKELGITQDDLKDDSHLNGEKNGGIDESYDSILKLFELMGCDAQEKVFKGATHFMRSASEPEQSEAVEHLVELALTASPEEPLYVIAIAAPTNIASAILMNPDILPNIVVIWDAGFPTNVRHLVNGSLNLEQDLYASQLLFNSGVPLVYIPGFYIAQQLNMSLSNLRDWFQESGEVGKFLCDRYMDNPLFDFYGIPKPEGLSDPRWIGRSWVIWDIANVAWLLNPGSVPSSLVKSPILTNEKKWEVNPDGHWMREAHQISVNAIFPQFAEQLKNWSSR
ncbi:nucleoside hydrolase [Okeania sp. SIO2B9]|uniref:nucleoside hydrolase n=1 Tax=Okeania sp. SIO2B9 TaxID=2607782 RepID=UPI00142B5557|nr:nucleoside hydrolase [Okeania sp. SIO2B9]NES90766.1 hypothetical protein [Okeania sp. SIO2B9]